MCPQNRKHRRDKTFDNMISRRAPPRSLSAYSYRSDDDVDDSMRDGSSMQSSSLRSSTRRSRSSIRRCTSDSSERATTTVGRNIERLMVGAPCPSQSVDETNRTRRESLRICRPKRPSLQIKVQQRQRSRSFGGDSSVNDGTNDAKTSRENDVTDEEWEMIRDALQQIS